MAVPGPPNLHADPAGSTANSGKWMALAAAFLGWMFDGLEMGLFPLVSRPALRDLLGGESVLVDKWNGLITEAFLIGAATGGVLFGWLGDRIGRVRAMTLSVLTYTLFMGMCGLVESPMQMFWCRFIAALGMGGEWSLGVSLVMEIWPNRSRGVLAGLIGAASNVGFLAIALVGLVLAHVREGLESGLSSLGLGPDTIQYLCGNEGWRLLMLLGATPALLTFLIRLFVPESEKWLHAKEQGGTSAWATRDLVAVGIGALGPLGMVYLYLPGHEYPPLILLIGTILGTLIALVGYSFPVFMYLKRTAAAKPAFISPHNGTQQELDQEKFETLHGLGPTMRRMLLAACLSGVALLGTWGALQVAVPWVSKMARANAEAQGMTPEEVNLYARTASSMTQIFAAGGAIIGTMVGGLLGHAIGRRPTYFLLCLASLGSAWLFFLTNTEYGPYLLATVMLAGATTASFYGWLPLYLPELFRTSVRATGQGFAFNFGRILAAVGALQTANLIAIFTEDTTFAGLVFRKEHPTACSIICLIYVVGMVIIWLAPETHGQELPE